MVKRPKLYTKVKSDFGQLGLQVKQKKDGIFISQDKYVAEILRKFRLSKGKSATTPMDAEKPLLKDSDGEDVDVHTYRISSDPKSFTPQCSQENLLILKGKALLGLMVSKGFTL
nr:ribonuclease H-like domain, reverse transcriptase, RNA-dependent DNA polymerase [Tanacetum cinerariifolium]